ncbi:MAG TPA: phosphotransferase [Mycobacteriales bacterium]|nr:phosphotransferase [Mycobacteriales bacterium]
MTAEILAAVRHHWGIEGDAPERLYGGEESASYRLHDQAIRIGPEWRTDAELEFSFRIAAESARAVPEITAPRPCRGGGYVVRVGARPISVWPYVAGTWADPADERQRHQAADLLARMHRAFAGIEAGRRPSGGEIPATAPEVADPALDAWLADFVRRRERRHPLHADYYRGNILVRDGTIAGVVDWDDVFVGPPEQELAWAAWEWSGGPEAFRVDRAREFIDRYVAAGGTADRIELSEFAWLVRGRIRMEVTYSRTAGTWGASSDPEDIAYEAAQVRAFQELRTLAQS